LSRSWLAGFPEFTIELSTINKPTVGDPNNKISYSFADFPTEAENLYRGFLQRVWPILYDKLGPPAESFNCVITNMGESSGYFMITNGGRKFLSDTDFIPRLIVHEFVHAWKGSYIFTSNENWEYDDALSGFEEGVAEGMAFEIIHEYVRSYPNDSATLQLLDWRPYQYWSSRTTFYDSIKYNRWTGAGDFWTHTDGPTSRYSIAATTFQFMMKENQNAYKEIMQHYFAKITEDPLWRSNREDILDIWSQSVPSINGIPTKIYINAIPVFQGHKLNEGMYILNTVRPYGITGDQQFATSYVLPDGQVWWGALKTIMESYNIPSWVNYYDTDPPDNYYYINTQDQPFTVAITNTMGDSITQIATRSNLLTSGEWNLGFGWKMVEDADMENLPLGLYKETVTFNNYIQYDPGAQEDFYVFGYSGLNQDRENDYVIMMGIDGVVDGFVTLLVDSIEYTEPIINGAAIFRSQAWPFDLEGKVNITITDAEQNQHTYYRTLLEAGTLHSYFQTQFIIIDKNFDGVEDVYWIIDADGDGIPNHNDPDDDNDTVLDNADVCPVGVINWSPSRSTDNDEDGCLDSIEDQDDDNDGLSDKKKMSLVRIQLKKIRIMMVWRMVGK